MAWAVKSVFRDRITIRIAKIRGHVTPLITTHEPPSTHRNKEPRMLQQTVHVSEPSLHQTSIKFSLTWLSEDVYIFCRKIVPCLQLDIKVLETSDPNLKPKEPSLLQ